MKAPLRPFEYMAWAKAVPQGARYNLTASGMADTALSQPHGEVLAPSAPDGPDLGWADAMSRRDVAWESVETLTHAVADRYGVDTELVTPTLGASLAITHVLMALVRAGDHVVVERPTYEPLHRAPEILGAQVSRLERTLDDGWAVVPERLAQLLTSKTKAVLLTNLHNPSGVATDAANLKEIAELAARVGAMVLVDEVYLDFDFATSPDAAIQPACRVAPNCISWSSTTKAFGHSSLRAGWIVSADRDAASAIRAATDYLHVYPPVATGVLGARVLRSAADYQRKAQETASAGRRVIERWVGAEDRVQWVPPTFGITCLLKLPDRMSDTAFTEHLRNRYETQVVPGSMFEAPGSVRVSFGIDPGTLEQGLANVSAALDDLA
ncbi:MAG: aminotransferase class I/II-fold pyridoxal phosphate-dependent enzyme [Nannocystaceae bacterium]|nr:aminotransferase class I/II-fold pyridoxal phosphate-dependent enzyme [Nannocystaceae bacterium]